MKNSKRKKIVCSVLCVLLVIVAIAADIICFQPSMYSMIDTYLSGGLTVTDPEKKNESYEVAKKVGESISDEGMVLLKNNHNTLPLTNVKSFLYTLNRSRD